MDIYKQIIKLLTDRSVTFETKSHEAARTSEASALARGESLTIGGKALLLKVDGTFCLFVLSASCRLNSSSIRKELGAKHSRFATPEELLSATGLVPGSVPPFGRPILPFDLYVDDTILLNDRIAFNAGSLTESIIFKVSDYLTIAQPTKQFSFSLPKD